jgi:hypothetical protein
MLLLWNPTKKEEGILRETVEMSPIGVGFKSQRARCKPRTSFLSLFASRIWFLVRFRLLDPSFQALKGSDQS